MADWQPAGETLTLAEQLWIQEIAALNPGANQVLGRNAADDAYEWKSIVAGDNITVTHTAGQIEITGESGGGTSDHGVLTGLSDDDHTQYLLADGSRELTGNWHAGDYSIAAAGNFNESTTTAGVYIGGPVTLGTPRVLFANGTAAQNWQIDNNGGQFRWYLPADTRMTLTATGLSFPSGTVIDFASSDVTITHAANTLTIAGGTSYVLTGATSGYYFDGLTGFSTNTPIAAGAAVLSLVGGDNVTGQDAGIHMRNELSNIEWSIFQDISDTDSLNIARETAVVAKFNASGQLGLNATPSALLHVRSSADAASVQTAIFEGDRATMADADEAYISLKLSDDGGTQSEFARITWAASDVNVGTNLDGSLQFSSMVAGTLSKRVRMDSTFFYPFSNDLMALGAATVSWSDLYLASGALINFSNGDVLITHSANTLAFTGGTNYTFDNAVTVGLAGTATGQLKLSGTTSGTAVVTVPAVAGTPTYVLPAAVGGAGTFLKDAAGDGILSWATPAGSGDVSKVGTPVDNQVGVWTGDGTIEGDVALTFDTSTDLLTTGALAIAGAAGAGYITLVAQASNPSSPAAGTLLLHSSTTQGFTRLEQDNEATTNLVLGRDNVVIAKNTSAGTISKGMPVYVTGSTGNVPNIDKARANSITTMPAIGVVMDDILTNAFGQVMVLGNLANFDTSDFSTGEQVYVSPDTAGLLTNTRPSGTTNIVQLVGRILVDGIGNGSMQVATAPFLGNAETGTNSATWSGTAINLSGLTASEIVGTDISKNLVSLAVATYPSLTELSYVKGVTSAIQTQFTGKANTTLANLGSVAINTTLVSDTDNTDALGTTAIAWSDLFLGSGAVITFNSAPSTPDVTITHSAETLTFAGGTIALGTATATGGLTGNVTGNLTGNADTVTGFSPAGGSLTLSGADALTLTTSAATNVTLPTTGTLATLAGTEELDSKTLDSSVGKGTWTASGTWTLPAITAGGVITLAENSSIALDPAGSADGKYSGITVAGTAGAALAFGDLIYLDPTDSRWELADANAAAAADGDSRGILGICVLAAAGDASATTVLLQGIVRADTAFPALTIGAPVYVSETAGDIVVTQPTTTDVVIRIVGIAITADEIFFNPDNSWITHT